MTYFNGAEISGDAVPFSRATFHEPAEGGYVEDIEILEISEPEVWAEFLSDREMEGKSEAEILEYFQDEMSEAIMEDLSDGSDHWLD